MSDSAGGAPEGGCSSAPRAISGAACVLVALAAFALWASRDLPGMRGFAFGPGTAPRMFASRAWRPRPRRGRRRLCSTRAPASIVSHFRGPFFIALSVVLFAWLVRPLGLVIASFLSILAAAGATPGCALIETLDLGRVADRRSAACLFPIALNLPLQLWPNSWEPAAIFKSPLRLPMKRMPAAVPHQQRV